MGRLGPTGNGRACPAKSDCHCCSGQRHRLDTDRRQGSHAARCGAGLTFNPGHLATSGDVLDVTTGGEHNWQVTLPSGAAQLAGLRPGAVCMNTAGHQASGTVRLQNERRVTGSRTLRPGKTPTRWAESGPSPTQGEPTPPRSQRPRHTTAAHLLTRPRTRAGPQGLADGGRGAASGHFAFPAAALRVLHVFCEQSAAL